MRFFLFLALLMGLSSVWAQPARVRLNFGANGLNAFITSAVNYINNNFQTVTIPDMSSSSKTSIGSVTTTISNIRIVRLGISSSGVGVGANGVFSANFNQLSTRVEFDWRYRTDKRPHISDHGSGYCEATASGGLTVQLGADGGKPTAHVWDANFDFSNLKIKLSGGASWLYDIFLSLFRNIIRKSINKAINEVLTSVVQNAFNQQFANFPTSISINKESWHVGIDARMASIVTVNSPYTGAPSFLSFGTVMQVDGCGYQPAQEMPAVYFDSPEDDRGLLEFQVDTTYLQCMIWAANSQGAIWSDKPTTVAAWASVIPALKNYFPADGALTARVGILPGTEPKFTINNSTGAGFAANAYIQLTGTKTDGTQLMAVKLRVDVDSQIALFLNTLSDLTYLTGKVSTVQLQLSVLETNVGPVSVNIINALIKMLLPPAEQMINDILGQGIPLPSPSNIRITYSDIDYQNGFAKFVSSFVLP